jgi:hypothetical protein
MIVNARLLNVASRARSLGKCVELLERRIRGVVAAER